MCSFLSFSLSFCLSVVGYVCEFARICSCVFIQGFECSGVIYGKCVRVCVCVTERSICVISVCFCHFLSLSFHLNVCVCENLRTFLSVCLFKGVESFGVIYGMFVSEFRCRKIMRCVCDCMINALVCVSLCV